MPIDAIITIIIISVAIVLFISEWFSIDLVAIGIIVAFTLTGVISPEQAYDGFSNEAVITIAAMFILSFAVIKSQIFEYLGPLLKRIFKKGYKYTIFSMSAFVGISSAFINNTPIVATFIPVINSAARENNDSPSKLLIPLSFIAIFGGSCTLIGTSTNILINSMSKQNGFVGLSMFDFTPIGLVLFAAGVLYLLFFGRKLIPERLEVDELTAQYGAKNFIVEVKINEKIEGQSIQEIFVDIEIEVNNLLRDGDKISYPLKHMKLKAGDVLVLNGDLDKISSLLKKDYFRMSGYADKKYFPEEKTYLVEMLLLGASPMIGKKINQVDFLKRFGASIIAVRHRGKKKFDSLDSIILKSEDILVLLTNHAGFEQLQAVKNEHINSFILLREEFVEKINKKSLLIVISTIFLVIMASSFGFVSLSMAAVSAVLFLNVIGILNMQESYNAIDWKIIILLAGALSMGAAIETSGLAGIISNKLILLINATGSTIVVLLLLYFITTILTEFLSNSASVVLMIPIVVSIGATMNYNLQPLMLTIAFAAGASFMTPIGYQTNTMVYSAGNYKFVDFLKIGIPLKIIFAIITISLIYLFYPLV